MSELQNQVKLCINHTEDFLAASFRGRQQAVEEFINRTYQKFLQYAWHDLPVSSADGSALATVSCMSLWELLNEYTSMCSLLPGTQKGFAVQALTSMYPKSKDRRCVFQQLNCCGNTPQTAVPLNTHIPLEGSTLEIPETGIQKEYVQTVQKISQIARSGSYTDGKEAASISGLLRSLVTTLLPKCVLASESVAQAAFSDTTIIVVLRSTNIAWNSGMQFLLAVWNALVIGGFLGLAESKELAGFLCFSRWASQVVNIGGRKVAYSHLLSPLVDICTLCISLNLRTPSTSVDTVPAVDPRGVELLCGDGYGDYCSNRMETDAYAYMQAQTTEFTISLAERRAERVNEQLNEVIPNEINFTGISSSCRDFDQLAYLCRDLLFLPSAKAAASKELLHSRNRDLLFNRKRGRGVNDMDGPCFIPVKSKLSAVMEKGNAVSQVSLERLCCMWNKE